MQWLRKFFSDAMKFRESSKVEKSKKLPVNYFLCLLWACLMHLAGRAPEAVALVKHLVEDMRSYCLRHPESNSVRLLQAVCLHNLAVSSISDNNLVEAFGWISQLQDILATTHVNYPKRCNELVAWAKTSQSQAQARFRRTRE
jgi:hypothetical protein